LPAAGGGGILVTMKKLSIAAAVLSLSIAAPAFACPGHEGHDQTPRTAEKAKAPASEAAKADKAKDAAPAKTADAAKPADKVSQK